MNIKEIRFSFIQVETLTAPLAALTAPNIPYKFLLNDALYQAEVAKILSGSGPRRLPWHEGFGKLFWYYYMEKKGPGYVRPKDAWRGLVPMLSDVGGKASADWLPGGTISTYGFLYPWGIGAIVDVHVEGSWS